MVAEFSINPMDSVHISRDLARLVAILDESGLEYRLGPMSTCVEGGWEEIMGVVRHCHQAMAAPHQRVITTIVIDDRKRHPHHLTEMVRSVEDQLSSRMPRADMDVQC